MDSFSSPNDGRHTMARGESSPVRFGHRAAVADAALWQALWGGAKLSANELGALQAAARTRSVGVAGMVFARHQPAREVVMLWRGDVGLGHCNAAGLFQLERVLHGPAWLDASSAWLGAGYARDACALSAATVLELPYSILCTTLERQPALAMRLLMALAWQVHDLAETAHNLMHKDADSRLAGWLMQHLDAAADSTPHAVVHLHERKRDIAAQLGVTPETLSRVMRSLSQKGLISVTGYTVRVLDVVALRQLAR